MLGFLGVILTTIGNVANGIFGFKKEQSEVIKTAIAILGDVSKSDDARASAAAAIIVAESNSESWITRSWRPLTVLSLVVILFSFFLGYSPPNVTHAEIARIFDIVEASILGYGAVRSVDKWMKDFAIGSVLKKFIEKKLI